MISIPLDTITRAIQVMEGRRDLAYDNLAETIFKWIDMPHAHRAGCEAARQLLQETETILADLRSIESIVLAQEDETPQ